MDCYPRSRVSPLSPTSLFRRWIRHFWAPVSEAMPVSLGSVILLRPDYLNLSNRTFRFVSLSAVHNTSDVYSILKTIEKSSVYMLIQTYRGY